MLFLLRSSILAWAFLFCLISTCRSASQAYFSLNEDELGQRDYLVANGNPMKGLITNPEFHYDPTADAIDSSMDCYYIPVGNVMHDDPDVVGVESAFNWTYVEDRIEASVQKSRHVVLTFAVHYPGEPLSLPRHLADSDQVPLHRYDEFIGGGYSPDYGSEPLLRALSNFVVALGKKYDGDNRVAFFHLGLLGFWGEWHTFPLHGLVPDYAKAKIAEDFRESFNTTKLQARYPESSMDGFGYYDGSFAYTTLDGEANGGVMNKIWYFWPMIQNEGQESFWRNAPMGGETRPEIQHEIFEDDYPRRTFKKQDFEEAVMVTHATYIMHSNAFINGGYNGTELENALRGHVLLGYNFVVTRVAAIERNVMSGVVDIEVTVQQDGVAPFYYELELVFDCAELSSARHLGGLEGLIDRGSTATFTVRDVPATATCLDAVIISLDSPMLLPGRPMKFSQGDGVLNVTLPVPTNHSEMLSENIETVGTSTDFDLTILPPPTSTDGQPTVSHTDEQTTTNVVIENEAMAVTFYYLASKTNGTEEWVTIRSGDSIKAPDFGLSIEVRPSEAVSSIWFSFASEMWIENLSPYLLPSNEYLTTTGSKDVVVTVYVADRIAMATTLNFHVIATEGDPIAMPASEKLSASGQVQKKMKPETFSESDSVHGFNTPLAPSLLQLVTLDRASTSSDTEEEEQVPGESLQWVLDGQYSDQQTWTVSAVSRAFKSANLLLVILLIILQ